MSSNTYTCGIHTTLLQRGADKGLVFLEAQHDRRAKQYTVPGARIRAIGRLYML